MSTSNEFKHEYLELFHAYEDDPLPVQSVAGRSGTFKISFNTGKWDGLKGLDDRSVNRLIYASFGYCLSKFTDNTVSAFSIYDAGLRPVLLDCSCTGTEEFLSNATSRFDERISSEDIADICYVASSISSMVIYRADTLRNIEGTHINLAVSIRADKLWMLLEHSDRFSDDFCIRFTSSLSKIMEGILSTRCLSEIDYISDADLKILDNVNDTSMDAPFPDILDAFRWWSQKTPDNNFVKFRDCVYSYSEAYGITGGLAAKLVSLGIVRGDVVGIFMDRSEWLALGPLAIMRAGAAYCNLDIALPDDRLQYMLEDCNPAAILVDKDSIERIRALTDIPLIDVGDVTPCPFPDVTVTESDIAILAYTSGTTGRPKGVIQDRGSLINCAASYLDIGLDRNSIVSLFVNLGFMFHVPSLYPPILVGSAVDVMPSEIRRDMPAMDEYFRSHHITPVNVTPSIAKAYSGYTSTTTLKCIMMAGEQVGIIDSDFESIMWVCYGCSEVASISHCRLTDRGNKFVVGRLDKNLKAFVVDSEGRRLPPGAVGVLTISGLMVMRGYLNLEELTLEKISSNRFTNEPGYDRLFNNGDLATIMPDGTIAVYGRHDNQLKIRGNRVETTEVEEVIRASKSVNQVTVQGMMNDQGVMELVAYIVGGDRSFDYQSLVASKKPEYMVPSHVLFIDSIPLNINGKVDRRALPKPKISISEENYVAPRNDVEGRICKAFAESFSLEKWGIDDDFVKFGGDSLRAIKVQSRIADLTTVSMILQYRTPRQIAEKGRIQSIENPYTAKTGCPLTGDQETMYMDVVMNGKETAYNMDFTFRTDASSEDALEALNKVIRAHPVICSRIEVREGRPYIVCDSEPSVAIRDEPPSMKEMTAPFDMETGPLSRFVICGKTIYGCVNHLVFDGMSVVVFQNEFVKAIAGKELEYDEGFTFFKAGADAFEGSAGYKEGSDYFSSMFSSYDDSKPLRSPDGKSGCIYMHLSAGRKRLSDVAASMGTTAYNILVSAFGYALSRFTGSEDTVFCTVESGRDFGNLSTSTGMFATTVPHRISCENRDTRAFILDSSKEIDTAKKHQRYPFRKVSERFGIRSDIVFQYRADLVSKPTEEETVIENGKEVIHHIDRDRVTEILAAVYDYGDDGLEIGVEHSDSYSDAFARSLAEVFDRILSGLMQCSRLSDIQYTSPEEISTMDSVFTDRPLSYPDVMDAFSHYLEESPDRELISARGRRFTFRECADLIGGLAESIRNLGTRRTDRVCILLERSEWFLLAPLAVLSVGSCYAGLDPGNPDDRLREIINDCNPAVIITDSDQVDRAKTLTDVPLILVDNEKKGEFVPSEYDPFDDAFIVYTSGSTGKPKGVVHTRCNLVSNSDAYISGRGLNEDTVLGMFCGLGFVSHATLLYPPVVGGFRLDIIPQDVRTDMNSLSKHVDEEGITIIDLISSVSRMFFDVHKGRRITVNMGGEPIGGFNGNEPCNICYTYGSSEGMQCVCQGTLTTRINDLSVGFPAPNMRVYVLDKENRRVPMGAFGHICISGPQLARGYFGDDPKLNVAFMDNPYADSEDNLRLFNTGDVGTILQDGSLGMLGRRDGQVKIRGNRVELTEIEAAIRECNGVKAVTVQKMTVSNEDCLVAYVVPDMDTDLDVQFIRDHVASSKPLYMVPSFVVSIDRIPLNSNGKVDKRALPTPSRTADRPPFVAPRNGREEELCNVFSEILGIESIGIDDSFVSLGGNSLMAIAVRSRLSFHVNSSDILRLATVRRIMESTKSVNFNKSMYTLETGCPLTESQLNVYLDQIVNGKETAYNNYFEVDLGDISLEKAESVLHNVFASYPILGCRIENRDVPYLVVGQEPNIRIGDAQGIRDPFDMAVSLSRFAIYSKEGHTIVEGALHHVIADGLSRDIVKSAISALPEYPAKPDLGFLVASAYGQAMAEYNEEAARFFEERFAGTDVDHGLIDDPDGKIGLTTITMSTGIRSLESFARKQGVSPGALTAAVFAYAISRHTGRSDAVFCNIDNGRDIPGVDRSVGMFVRTLPVHIDTSDDTVDNYLQKATVEIMETARYGSYPFRKLSKDYGVNADITFQFTAGFIDIPMSDLHEGFTPLDEKESGLTDEMSVNMMGSGDSLIFSVLHTARFAPERVISIGRTFDSVLSSMVAGKVSRMKEIQLASEEDIRREEDLWSTCETRFTSFLDAFKHDVAESPDSVYISYEGVRITYKQADIITSSISSALNKVGAGRGVSIASFVERSEWYGLVFLAIQKSGAVYVPMDLTYPDERLGFMMEDADVKAVLVTPETAERASSLTSAIIIDVTSVEEDSGEDVSQDPDAPSLILYTSGTTGKPKGSIISNRSVNNFSEWYAQATSAGKDDKFALYASYGFDAHLMPICGAIYCGCCLDIIPESVRLDMGALNDHLESNHVTELFLPTSVGRMFTASQSNSVLKHLFVGGEASGNMQPNGTYKLIDGYGPTENLIFTCTSDVEGRFPSSIGRPLPNNRLYILDSEKRRLPYGAIGELYIAGHQLADGYLNRPDADKKAYSVNPYSDDPLYGRLYNTGDYCRYLPDSTVMILGRRDGQVKIRGNRVELTEVEACILSMDGIDKVTVQPRVAESGIKELCAYVVATGNIIEQDVREYIAERKPAYMVPAYVVLMDSIPLTVNGKVDRRALPEPHSSKTEGIAPRNEIEKILCDAFSRILDMEQVYIDDDFVSLGGDSIKAISVSSLVRKEGLTVSAQDIIKKRTVRAVATITVASEYNAAEVTGGCEIVPNVQIFESSVPDKDHFYQFMVLRSDSRIDVTVLQKAFDKVTDHHDILRSRFDGHLRIGRAGQSVCHVGNMIINRDEDIADEVRKILSDLDILEGRMISCCVVECHDYDLLCISIHHLVVDAVSWNIILQDLLGTYSGMMEGSVDRLPSKTQSYKEWAEKITNLKDSLDKAEVDYWIGECKGITSCSATDTGIRTLESVVPVTPLELSDNPFRATLDQVMIAGLAKACHQTFGESIVHIAMEGHGRIEELGDVSRTVGWFTSLYPISIPSTEDMDDIMWNTIEKMNAVPSGGIGYGVLRLAGVNGITGLPPVSFNYLSDSMSFCDHGFSQWEGMGPADAGDPSLVVHGISINVFKESNRFRILCYCDRDTIYDENAEDLVNKFSENLISFSKEFSRRMSEGIFSCGLSIPTLNVLLDESKGDMGNAYNSPNILNMPEGTSVEVLRAAVDEVIRAHPALRIRVGRKGINPWFICDSIPDIRIIEGEPDYEEFNSRFDFHKGVSRFWIVKEGERVKLMMNIHHLAVDNLSIGNLRKDIIDAYGGKRLSLDLGFIQSAADNVPEYSPEYSRSETYFDEMFSGADMDSSPVSDGSDRPCDVLKRLDIKSDRVEAFCRKEGITANNLFMSAFAYTLSRFTGRSDSIFCMMENGRDTPELERSVGMFARILPILIDCKDSTVKDFLQSVGDRVVQTVANHGYPFYEIVRRFGVTGAVQFQYVPSQNFLESFEHYANGNREHVLTDFDFNIMTDGDGYVCYLLCCAKYHKSTAERFVDSYVRVLNGLMRCERLSEIQYVSEDDLALQDSYNDTAKQLINRTAIEAFHTSLMKDPEAVLVKYLDKRISYVQAENISNGVADALIKAGVKVGDRVAMLVPRSELYVTVPLGIIKSGAAYVPIDDSYPDDRVLHMLTDSKPAAAVAVREMAERIHSLADDIPVVCVEDVNPSEKSIARYPTASDICVVLYTSGTTGKPKGSQITHRAVVNMCEWYVDFTHMTPEDCYGYYTSTAFDIHTMAVFAAMFCGASVDVVPEDIRLDMEALNDHYVSQNVTHTFITTQVGKLFASSGFETTVRFLLYGGEKLGVFTAPESIGACESYGPSENLSLSTAIYVNDRKDPSSVGYLLPNIKAYVLDAEKRRIPNGAVGELYLAGSQLSTGYLDREELNAKVFSPNPFDTIEGYETIYATGDFFRWLPDGTLGVLGRRDGQVKIRGNRVELTEVDAVIRGINGIRDVTVQPIVNSTGGKELCAYVVIEPGSSITASEITSFVAASKPAYMVPAYVIIMDSIPLTVNAKVDKRRLPKPDTDSLRAQYAAPRNDLEVKCCKAFEQILGVEQIGIDDDFIQLGGDSIKAIRLLPLLHDMGLENIGITPADVLAMRTVRAMMQNSYISGQEIADLYNQETGSPLTDAQRSMYEYIRNDPGTWYNLPFSISMDWWKDPENMKCVLEECIRSTPILRSRLSSKGEEPMIYFDSDVDIQIVYADPNEIAKIFVTWFDIEAQPLFRAAICYWEERVTVLSDIHHLIFDGRSIGAFVNKMISIYRGESPKFDDGQFRVAAYDKVMKGSERYQRSKQLAERVIAGSCTDYLPMEQSEKSGFIAHQITADGDRIRKYIRENRLSVAGFFAAILGRTFTELSGKDRCLFFLTHDGRGHIPLDDSIDLYAKGAPVSVETADKDVVTIMKDVSSQILECMSFDEYSVWEMMKDHGVKWNIRFQYANFYSMDGASIFDHVKNLRGTDMSIADFWSRMTESGDGYMLIVTRSKKISDRLLKQVVEIFDRLVTETIEKK